MMPRTAAMETTAIRNDSIYLSCLGSYLRQVSPGLEIQVAAADGLLKSVDRKDIRAGVDNKVFVQPPASVGASLHSAGHFLGGDNFLARHMPAALGEDLVFDVHAGPAHGD